MQAVTKTLQEIQADPGLKSQLTKVAQNVGEEDMAHFTGMLSDASPEMRKQVFEAMKRNPGKVEDAVQKSAREGGVCR
jgi:hypothetical protein